VEDVEDLIFTPDPEELTRPPVRRARPAPRPTTDILAELSRATPLQDQPMARSSGEAASSGGLSAEEREERVAAVLSEILADPDSGYRTDSALYQDFWCG
jgi:hypothetical protein